MFGETHWGHPSRNGRRDASRGRPRTPGGRNGQAERATERLALDPLAALDPSSASAHAKTVTLRSPISQFVQCPCQGLGLMSSHSSCEGAWRPWISRGPLRDASISRAAPGRPAARGLHVGPPAPAGRAQSPQGRRWRAQRAPPTATRALRRNRARRPIPSGDVRSRVADPDPPPSRTGATGERRRCLVALAAPAAQSGPESGVEFEGGRAEPAPRS
jgi:hypothetical protein